MIHCYLKLAADKFALSSDLKNTCTKKKVKVIILENNNRKRKQLFQLQHILFFLQRKLLSQQLLNLQVLLLNQTPKCDHFNES